MRELGTAVDIHAAAERVWAVLADLDRWGEWNPFARAVGRLEEGGRLEVRLTPPGGTPITIRPKIIKLEPGRELRWLGHLLVPGLFDGEHIFRISPMGPQSSRFEQREVFRGLLVAPVLALVRSSTLRGFEAMNRALKARAESLR